MSADKKTVTKKIKNIILVISTILIVSYIILTIYTMWNYISTKMVYDLNEQEYAAICEEYFLDPQTADIEYIFHAGRDYYGVRLLLSENDLKDMNILFKKQVFDEKNSNYFKVKESRGWISKTPDGAETEKYRLSFLEPTPEHLKYDTFCYVFEIDGKYYMEMNHQYTNNAAIYCKNIK